MDLAAAYINAALSPDVQSRMADAPYFVAPISSEAQFSKGLQAYAAGMKALEAMTVAVAHRRKIAAELDAKAFEALKAKMQYDPMPPAALDEMRRATVGIVDVVKKRVAPELVDRIVAETARAR